MMKLICVGGHLDGNVYDLDGIEQSEEPLPVGATTYSYVRTSRIIDGATAFIPKGIGCGWALNRMASLPDGEWRAMIVRAASRIQESGS